MFGGSLDVELLDLAVDPSSHCIIDVQKHYSPNIVSFCVCVCVCVCGICTCAASSACVKDCENALTTGPYMFPVSG